MSIRNRWPSGDTSYVREVIGGNFVSNSLVGLPALNVAPVVCTGKAVGWRTAFGRSFTSQHVGYICRRDGVARGTLQTGLMSKGDPEKIH